MERTEHSGSMLFVVIAALVLALSGCTVVELLTTRFEKPTITYKGIELVEASQQSVVVNFVFSAHNPNEAGLKNVICSYELFVEGGPFLKEKDVPLALNPKGETEIKVPAVINYSDLFPVLGSVVRRILSGQNTVPVTIDAVFSGKPAIYSKAGKDEPFSFETRLIKTVEIPLTKRE